MKTLVVDDSKTMRSIVKQYLRKAGYGDHEVVEAGDGAEAIKLVESENPDLMITDIDMPEMTGFELVKEPQKQGKDITFGVASAQGGFEAVSEAIELGARFMLLKPFKTDIVKRAIDHVMQDLEAKDAVAAEKKNLVDEIDRLKEENQALQERISTAESQAS
jgi:two-component system chemotaxis response regulator CheY